jgi:hypothetical protein
MPLIFVLSWQQGTQYSDSKVLATQTLNRRAHVSADSVPEVGRPPPPKKIVKLKQQKFHKFQNAPQTRTGRNMVKFSCPNAPSTWLIFLRSLAHASRHKCHNSASSFLVVRIRCRVIAVLVFRKFLFTEIMAPKIKRRDVGSASKAKRSRDVICEK